MPAHSLTSSRPIDPLWAQMTRDAQPHNTTQKIRTNTTYAVSNVHYNMILSFLGHAKRLRAMSPGFTPPEKRETSIFCTHTYACVCAWCVCVLALRARACMRGCTWQATLGRSPSQLSDLEYFRASLPHNEFVTLIWPVGARYRYPGKC
jgi:hypothetical protein